MKMEWNRGIVLCGLIVLVVTMGMSGFASEEAVAAYERALDQWTQDYLMATLEMTVKIGENVPASYTLMLWAKGTDTAISVITDADVDFLLGLSMLQENRQITAWWPTLERSKTFSSRRTDEEIGLNSGWMEQVAQHPEEYEASFLSDDEDGWAIELHPLENEPLFHRAVVYVRKDLGVITRAEFYDAEGILVEVDRVLEHIELTDPNGDTLLFPHKLEVYDVEEDKTTSIVYLNLELPAFIDEAQFTLEKVKEISLRVLEGEL